MTNLADDITSAPIDAAGELTEVERPSTAVAVRNLTVTAGRRILLFQAHAEFAPGKITLIIGASGTGKSVLLRILSGLIDESHSELQITGQVLFDGRDVWGRSGRPPVGVVFQNFALFDELSPTENVRFARAHRSSRDSAALPDLEPESLLAELQVPTTVRTASLSGGQQQRLAIARTLAYNPDVILYDEPTSGLDAATATEVAELIRNTHETHGKTSIIVTHDYEALAPIADAIYVIDPSMESLRKIEPDQWSNLREHLKPADLTENVERPRTVGEMAWATLKSIGKGTGDFFAATSKMFERAVTTPLTLLPIWRSPVWGARFFLHYARLVAGPSAWAYIAMAGVILGFVATFFTYEYLPYAKYTEPLIIEDLLNSIGFALYRILVPILATVLVAARCGAAVASDIGGKTYTRQMDALRTFGVSPGKYLLTNVLYAFLVGMPLLTAIGFFTAKMTSLVVFTSMYPDRGPSFWELHFHKILHVPGETLYDGTLWLLAKLLTCAVGIALIAYYRGAAPKYSSRDVSRGITSAILWSTLWVLVVHFGFTFFEYEQFGG